MIPEAFLCDVTRAPVGSHGGSLAMIIEWATDTRPGDGGGSTE